MNPREFTHYIGQSSHLASLSIKESSARERLFQLIEKEKNKFQQSFPFHNFFKAEQSFYKCQYEQALKLYLEAKGVPHYQFFCYRATAYIQIAQGDKSKAESYAQKALEIYPNDFPTQQIMDLIHKPGNYTDNHRSVSPSVENKNEAEPIPKISLGEKEIEELASIFETNTEIQEELFAFESPAYHNYSEKEQTPIAALKSRTTVPEPIIRTESGIFSNPDTNDPATTAELTQRLYSTPQPPAFSAPQKSASLTSLDEPKVQGNEADVGSALEQRIKGFQIAQSEQIQSYLELYNKRTAIPDHFLCVLHGWHCHPFESSHALLASLTESSRKTSGGFFLRWNGKGIAINPGLHFLKNFHKQGLHIKDIDFVIVTRDNPDAYADVKEIYELNVQLNKVASELQIIHYYLNQKAYQELSPTLKPHYKQERNAIHRLELFVDSPDVEKLDLDNGIALCYFPVTSHEAFYQNQDKERRGATAHSCLGIRLELKTNQNKPPGPQIERSILRLGYVSGTSWSPLLSHHLGNCDLLIAGMGNINANDYSKVKYCDEGLGFLGTFSLLEEIAPKLLLCCEFSGREGDVRIEAIKKMRQEYSKSTRTIRTTPVVLPGDDGLLVDLKSLQVRCSINKAFVDPAHVRVVKTVDSFGGLQYLSPECCL